MMAEVGGHADVYRQQQRGVALITAVLVAAMITATAVTMATTHKFSIQRGFNQLNASLIEHGVKALELDISNALVEDRSLSAVDSLDEQWGTTEWTGEYPNTSTNARVTDLQALFNLQNLAAQFGPSAFRNRPPSANPAAAPNGQPSFDQTDSGASGLNSGNQANRADVSALSSDPLPSPNTSEEQTQEELFDWRQHQEFIDSYVSYCAQENQDCAREAISVAYQQFRSSGNVQLNNTAPAPTATNLNSNSSPIATTENQVGNPEAIRTPNGPVGSTGGAQQSDSSGAQALDSEAQLAALFRALDLDLEPVQAILDWIDQDSETRYPNGAEDEYYTGLELPYRTANGPFVSLRELLLVRGVTREIYEKLVPHLSVLPQATPVNINTAGAEVLMAIHPMIDRSTAGLLIDSREVQPFQTVKAFVEHPALLGLSIPTGQLSTSSEYFLINAKSSTAGMQTSHQAVLKRSNSNTFVLRRSRGYFN